jgi:crossover junction endodeoxyribonuclease RuvC
MGISSQQYKEIQDRLGATKRPTKVIESSFVTSRTHRIILGIDPSLRGTGYGLISLAAKSFPESLGYGTINCKANWPHSRCLVYIVQSLREVIQQYQPTLCVIEGLFYAQNLQTAQIMGEVRGAALATVAEAGLEIYELAPRKVKQAIVGYGAAQKIAVAKMVQRMLRLAETPAPDAADALALALAHTQGNKFYSFNVPKRI